MSESLFRWEFQVQTSETSPTGVRYAAHAGQGSHVMLFVRRHKHTDIGGPQPWLALRPAAYIKHKGSKPTEIVWKLAYGMPADVWTYSAIAAS